MGVSLCGVSGPDLTGEFHYAVLVAQTKQERSTPPAQLPYLIGLLLVHSGENNHSERLILSHSVHITISGYIMVAKQRVKGCLRL